MGLGFVQILLGISSLPPTPLPLPDYKQLGFHLRLSLSLFPASILFLRIVSICCQTSEIPSYWNIHSHLFFSDVYYAIKLQILKWHFCQPSFWKIFVYTFVSDCLFHYHKLLSFIFMNYSNMYSHHHFSVNLFKVFISSSSRSKAL